MADLRAATRQTVHRAVLDCVEVVYVEILQDRVSPRNAIGARRPASGARDGRGKALLASSGDQVVEDAGS